MGFGVFSVSRGISLKQMQRDHLLQMPTNPLSPPSQLTHSHTVSQNKQLCPPKLLVLGACHKGLGYSPVRWLPSGLLGGHVLTVKSVLSPRTPWLAGHQAWVFYWLLKQDRSPWVTSL